MKTKATAIILFGLFALAISLVLYGYFGAPDFQASRLTVISGAAIAIIATHYGDIELWDGEVV